jgi:MoxR-like ATPase
MMFDRYDHENPMSGGKMSHQTTPYLSINEFQSSAKAIVAEIRKVMVGQEDLIHDLMVTLLAGGNALLEGVPGLGKTLLVRTLSQAVDCSFNRIQFTPDLMPADIIGTMIITETREGRRGFRFEPGPIFANLILADEINRATPRTQSALLEAMQEWNVTVAGETRPLPRPFFVLATQNPIEMEGTYPLPEAQVDRFLYKITVPYPSENELVEIAMRTTGSYQPRIQQVVSPDRLLAMQRLARDVPVGERVLRYGARLIETTHPTSDRAPDAVRRHLRYGASPRGLQSMVWSAKVEALLDGRKAVAVEDLKKTAFPALRHRILLNFEAQAENVDPDGIISAVLGAVNTP